MNAVKFRIQNQHRKISCFLHTNNKIPGKKLGNNPIYNNKKE